MTEWGSGHVVLVVDGSPILYTSYAKLGHLKTSYGEQTGVRYGFMRNVRSVARKFKASKIVVAWDLPGVVKKAQGSAEYKSNRVMTEDKTKMYDEGEKLKEFMALTAWTQAEAQGYEADDVVGTLTRNLVKDDRIKKIIVFSPDNDFLQLIHEGEGKVEVWWKRESKFQMKGRDYVVDNFAGMHMKGLLLYRAMVGDKSDNLSAPMFAPHTKESLFSQIKEYSHHNGAETDDMFIDRMEMFLNFDRKTSAVWDKFLTNYEVMKLHDAESMVIRKGRADIEEFQNLCRELEMNSFLKNPETFMDVTKS